MEDVAGQALGVHADEDVLHALDLALDQRDVLLLGEELPIRHCLELAVLGREPHRHRALDELLPPAPVLDEVGDGDHLQAVQLAERGEIRHAGHRPVVVHDLAHHTGRKQAGEPREVDRRLGLAGALEHAALLRAEREDVAGLDEVVSHRPRVDRDLDRPGAIVRRDSRRHAFARFDRHGEGGAERSLVVVGHRPQLELVAALGREAEADEPAAVRRHERDRLRRDELRRDRQVALVLAVGVVDDDHEAAAADVLDRLLDGRERRCRLLRAQVCRHVRIVDVSRAQSAARRTSRGRRPRGSRPGPAASAESVVASSVCGTSATAKASSLSSATVSDTPSTVIEPFSTQ